MNTDALEAWSRSLTVNWVDHPGEIVRQLGRLPLCCSVFFSNISVLRKRLLQMPKNDLLAFLVSFRHQVHLACDRKGHLKQDCLLTVQLSDEAAAWEHTFVLYVLWQIERFANDRTCECSTAALRTDQLSDWAKGLESV